MLPTTDHNHGGAILESSTFNYIFGVDVSIGLEIDTLARIGVEVIAKLLLRI